jgi:dTDP-4-dehydrorhamnose 3,5-epimerase-like enzyme
MEPLDVGIQRNFSLQTISDETGKLTVLEPKVLGSFAIQRVYFLHSLRQDAVRGAHAHRNLEQLVVALHGTVTLQLEKFGSIVSIELSNPEVAHYIPPMTWRDLSGFSEGAVCAVFASAGYDEADYIRDYDEFSMLSKNSMRADHDD